MQLEAGKTYAVGGAGQATKLDVGNKDIRIVVSPMAGQGAERPMIEVDSDTPFAEVPPGGKLRLGGVGLKRSASAVRRQLRAGRALQADNGLINNNGGTLVIEESELRSEVSPVITSKNNGELEISDSSISGVVNLDGGEVTIRDSSFADADPMVSANNNARLVVGPGNSLKPNPNPNFNPDANPNPDPNPHPNPHPDSKPHPRPHRHPNPLIR